MKTDKMFLFQEKYLGIASLNALHHQSKEWLKDIAFWTDEAKFLKKLIQKNFILLMAQEGLSIADRLAKDITKLKETDLNNLEELVNIHELRLSQLIQKPNEHEEQSYRREHRWLETKVREIVLKKMALKRQIFEITEELLKEQNAKRPNP